MSISNRSDMVCWHFPWQNHHALGAAAQRTGNQVHQARTRDQSVVQAIPCMGFRATTRQCLRRLRWNAFDGLFDGAG